MSDKSGMVVSSRTNPVAEAGSLDDRLVAALQRGDAAGVEAILAERTDPLPQDLLGPVAELHLQRGRYAEAARLLNRVIERTPVTRLLSNLAKNLRALSQHRPAMCEQVAAAAPDADRFQITEGADGLLTINALRSGASPLCLSPGNRPSQGTRDAMAQLESAIRDDQAVALCGVGDGYLLAELARLSPEPVLGRELNVHLIEPDLALLRTVLMLHDLSGAHGPIAHGRFRWWVGADWAELMHATLAANPYLPVPPVHVRQGLNPDPLVEKVQAMIRDLTRAAVKAQKRIDAYYAGLSRDDLVRVMRSEAERRPRILLLTTRFSTVLQHSTADTAAAFEQLGWEAETVIEPDRDHRTTIGAVRNALDRFRPDLVFQIDHLRSEYPSPLFPDNLPFVCWIQDHLGNLTNPAAGASVGPMDFVLTAVGDRYIQRFGYPERQVLPVSKLTRLTPEGNAVPPSEHTADLAFVSNASQVPERLAERIIAELSPSAIDPEVAERSCQAIRAVYERGETLATYHDLDRQVQCAERELGRRMASSDSARETFIRRELQARLNNVLYRQQALGWIAERADQHGDTLALYGQGWEDHPRFAPHARGPIAYGSALAAMTRATPINLQIVPFFAIHQRLLDGLAAGGFFLVREHPMDRAAAGLARFVSEQLDPAIRTTTDARQRIAPDQRDTLEAHLSAMAPFADAGDPVRLVRQWLDVAVLTSDGEILPKFDAVTFRDRATLADRLATYLHAPDAEANRHAVIEAQRKAVADRLSYAAGMERTIRQIVDRLEGGGNG